MVSIQASAEELLDEFLIFIDRSRSHFLRLISDRTLENKVRQAEETILKKENVFVDLSFDSNRFESNYLIDSVDNPQFSVRIPYDDLDRITLIGEGRLIPNKKPIETKPFLYIPPEKLGIDPSRHFAKMYSEFIAYAIQDVPTLIAHSILMYAFEQSRDSENMLKTPEGNHFLRQSNELDEFSRLRTYALGQIVLGDIGHEVNSYAPSDVASNPCYKIMLSMPSFITGSLMDWHNYNFKNDELKRFSIQCKKVKVEKPYDDKKVGGDDTHRTSFLGSPGKRAEDVPITGRGVYCFTEKDLASGE